MNKSKKVTIITGRAKSGKTAVILQKIAENERQGRKSLFIVPSQNSFEYEKMLAHACGGGFMNASVCGLYRLGDRLLEEAGLCDAFVNAQGRIMIIRRAIEEAELTIFRDAAKRPGFAIMCDEYISNFQTFDLTPAQIRESVEKLNHSSVLYEKMTDLVSIYEKTDEYLTRKALRMKAASENIAKCIETSEICKADIFFDGIENPFPQTYKMINAMLSACDGMTIAIEADPESDEGAFNRENDTFLSICKCIEDAGYSYEHIHLTKEKKYTYPEFDHIESEFWKFPSRVYAGESSSHVELIAAGDMTKEVEMLVAAITEKVKSDKGVRYRNMAVIAADKDAYDVLVKSKFAQADIPIFSDNKLNLLCTCYAQLVMSAIFCVSNGFRAEDVCSLIKTNMAGLSYDEIEIFENFLITSGKSGADLKMPFPPAHLPDGRIEDIRKKVIEPLDILREGMSRGTVAEKIRALRKYTDGLCAKKQLEDLTKRLYGEGNTVAAKQYDRVYELVDNTLSQLESVLGDIRVSSDDFREIVAEGLTADIVGIIPSSVDMVFFDDVTGNVPKEADYVFIIGACDGSLPPNRRDDKIIDDTELSTLKDADLPVWLSVSCTRDHDMQKLYRLISSADKLLYISYPMKKGSSPALPCNIMNKLKGMFGRENFDSDVDFSCRYRLHNMDTAARCMRRIADKRDTDETDRAYLAWFMKSDKYAAECKRLEEAIFFDPSPLPLGSDLVQELYGGKVYGSVSRIETYHECPFRYFAEHTLRAKERRAYSPESTDVGSFLHDVLDKFFKKVMERGLDVCDMKDGDIDALIEICVSESAGEYRQGLFEYNSRLRSLKNYYAGKAAQVIHAIIRQLRRGQFKVCATETAFNFPDASSSPSIEFDVPGGGVLSLTGKIDRVDVYNDGEDHYQIVDYKTGSVKFRLEKLYAGIQIQLPVYLEAICRDKYDGCGMYYMSTKAAPAGKTDDPERLAEIDKSLRMDGVTAAYEDGEDKTSTHIYEALSGDDKIPGSGTHVVSNTTLGKKVSGLVTRGQIAAIRRFAVKRATEAAQGILSGDIKPYPYADKDIDACKYCKYKWVCMFDESFPSCKHRKIPDFDIGEIFDDEV